MKNLWAGRFSGSMNNTVQEYNASIGFDRIFYSYDIKGSIAHATMLADQGIISNEEKTLIVNGLTEIKQRIFEGKVEFSVQDEDIHMTVERLLIEEIGEPGKKLHSARSRNDQNAVDERLYLKDKSFETHNLLRELLGVLLTKAEQEIHTLMPGFTHSQHAQPITAGFYYMAWFQMFRRDLERFHSSYERLDICPLGACALAGTTLPIDRQKTAKLLGFSKVTENAMDSVSDRDYILEYLFNASTCMMHLSRFAEEFVIHNSPEYGFIQIHDSFCTGSSIMPQKKNPDIAELVRGKVGRVYGSLITLLTVMKGAPLAFNKDFQEDKEALFDCVNTLNSSLHIFAEMLEKTTINRENTQKHLEKGFINATDIAEYLVKKGMPFRKAHETVGLMVKYCESQAMKLEDLSEQDLQKLNIELNASDIKEFSYSQGVINRNSYGGTSPEDVKRQIKNGREFLIYISQTR